MIDISGILAGPVRQGELLGAAAAAVTPDGVSTGAAGEASPGRPWADDTVFWIASMTKAVTAVAAMQLVEAGTLDLDAPAGELVPFLGEVPVLDGYDAAGQAVLRAPATPVTLRHLLTHTAGFAYEFTNARLAEYMDGGHFPHADAPSGSRASYQQPLMFDPGTAWCYGLGIDWAGQVIEAATGTRVDEHVTKAVIEPCGMSASSFYLPASRAEGAAAVYRRSADLGSGDADGGFTQVPWSVAPDDEMVLAGGGMYSTVTDYLRFCRMILGDGTLDGERLLAPETVATMAADHAGDVEIHGWRSPRPSASNDVTFPGPSHHWGLSFLINAEAYPGGRSAGSLAWGGLANTYFWIDRVGQRAGVFATQLLPFWDRGALDALTAVEHAAYAS